MADIPNDQPTWMHILDPDELHEVPIYLAGDPYLPQDAPVSPTNFAEEDEIEEDEEHYDEGILQDAQ